MILEPRGQGHMTEAESMSFCLVGAGWKEMGPLPEMPPETSKRERNSLLLQFFNPWPVFAMGRTQGRDGGRVQVTQQAGESI